MTGKQATVASRPASGEPARTARQTQWSEVGEPRLKAAVRADVERRGLASFMNATRWRRLVDAVYAELPFAPPFQLQPVLGDREPPWDHQAVDYWGAWSELEPFFAIEWLRVLPAYRKPTGRLLAGEWVECAEAFRALLIRLRVPYREDAAGTFWIYGYAPADPATLTPADEAPT